MTMESNLRQRFNFPLGMPVFNPYIKNNHFVLGEKLFGLCTELAEISRFEKQLQDFVFLLKLRFFRFIQ